MLEDLPSPEEAARILAADGATGRVADHTTAALGKAKGFEGIDGVDQWAHLTGATYTTFGPLALPVV